MINIPVLLVIATWICSVLSEVSVFLPYGNHVGIGLSFPMVITVKPDNCVSCPLIIEVVPPYFTNSQINQPMLNLENCIVRYIGSNVVSKSITAGDTVESNNFINIIDGVLSINFGNVDVPAGSTDSEIIVSLDLRVRNMYTIQNFNVLTLQIKEQLDNQFNFVKESLQVVKPELPRIQTFEPEDSRMLYQSKDEPAIIFSVKLPVTSATPVYNISITCSVRDASPNFRTATTNPNSVSIVVVEQDGVELIHFQADELKPGHVIVGRFGVYLHNTLRPDKLNMDMSVVSYSAPIHNNGRQLDTVQSNLIVPVKLKYPVLTLVDYPESSLVGVPFNVTLSVELPPLLVNYKVEFSAVFGVSSSLTFISVTENNKAIDGSKTITDNMVIIEGEGVLEEETRVLYTISARVKPSLQTVNSILIIAGLTYKTDSKTKSLEKLEKEMVVQHPALQVEITSSEAEYVTLGEAVSYLLTVTHLPGSVADAHQILLNVELSVPGILNCEEQSLSVSQLSGRKVQISEDHLGVGEVLKIQISATPTSDDMLQNKMKLLVNYSYQSCPASFCQTYGLVSSKESTGLKIHSTDIGTEFLPSCAAVKHPFSLKIIPVRDADICEYNATITLPSAEIIFQSVVTSSQLPISVKTEGQKIRINFDSPNQKVENLEVVFDSEVENPGRIHTFALRSSFKMCDSDLIMEETTNPSIEIADAEVDITITASTPTVQCKTEFTYKISLQFDKPIPVYGLSVRVFNAFVKFSSGDSRITQNKDGFTLLVPQLDSDTTFNVSGTAEGVTLSTDTTASWSYQYFSARENGKVYSGSFSLPKTKINQPTFTSFIENKVAGKITIGEDFVFGIEVITSEMLTDFVIRFQLPECNGDKLFEVVEVSSPVVGDDVFLTTIPNHQTSNRLLEIWLQTDNRANSFTDKGDLLTQRVTFRSLFSMLQCQNTKFPLTYTVDFGLAPDFERFQDTKYLNLSGPDLKTEFSIIPSLERSRDAKDLTLFDLKLWHTAQSSAPAYNITVELVCEELNMLSFNIMTPPPLGLEQGAVSVRFARLSVGETFAAIVRAELKQDVLVSRAVTCGGKVEYMSSDNEPSLNYIYTTTFESDEIQLAKPAVSLWDVGSQGNIYEYRVEVEVPEGKLSSLIITLNVGMGIFIEECQIDHLSLTSTQQDAVIIGHAAAEVNLGEVYNKPDNLKTEKDKVSLKIKLEKRLPFADLNLVYATLDGERTKTFAVSWRNECNLLLNLVRRDETEFVEGGDEIRYDVVVSHDIRSQVDCVNGRIFLLLDYCDIQMPEQLEIRSKKGIRKMVYIEKSEESAIFTLDSIELGDEYTVPITVHISDTIHPGTKISLQSYIMYRSDSPGALQRRSKTSYPDSVLSSVPQTTAILVTQHNSDAVSIGETVQISCLISIPRGMLDLSVHASGDGTDSVLMTGISSNMTSLTYENLQITKGLNHGLMSYTKLYNPPEEAVRNVLFTIAPQIYDSDVNVDGRELSLRLVVGYSLTERKMIEDVILFTLKIVEPVLEVMSSVTPSLEAELVYITLHYSHSTPPYLKTSSANAYSVKSTIAPAFSCTSDHPDVSVFNNTVVIDVLELGQELKIQLSCQSSPSMELGKRSEIVIDTTYSSNSLNGRSAHHQVKTGFFYKSQDPVLDLSISGLDGENKIKLNENVAVELSIRLPVGVFPGSKMNWRSSENLLFVVYECVFEGADVITKISTNSLGQVAEIGPLVNDKSGRTIECVGDLTTVGELMTMPGGVTVAVNYGINTGIISRAIQITVPRLQVDFEVADGREVSGNEIITAKFTIFHMVESSGDAFNFWLNSTTDGASIGGSNELNTPLGQVTLSDTRSLSFTLTVNPNLLPLSPVSLITRFSYSTSPTSGAYYTLPEFQFNELRIRDIKLDVSTCQNQNKVSVGGLGFICITITLPVCRTGLDINVKHPLLKDRELAEVVDGAKVSSGNPISTSFTQSAVRHLITRTDLSITDITNTGSEPDTLSLQLPILVFANEEVYDNDLVKFTLVINHEVFGGKKETNAEVSFTVTEPKLSLKVTISDSSDEKYQKDDKIAISYTIRHNLTSSTPAYNLKLKSNSTMFRELSTGAIVSKLDSGEEKEGSVSLILGELPEFGAVEEVRLVLEYCSTPTDVGRMYYLVETAGTIGISGVSASINISHERIPIGQTFTILVNTDMPKGKGDVNITVNCEDHCQFLGELKLLTELNSAVVEGNTLTLSDITGGRELKMEINGYLTDESMKNANITVDINGKVVTHHLIRVAEISLKFENLKGDRKMVDAGNNVEKSFELVFNGTVYDTRTSLSCNYTHSNDLSCQDNSCTILATISNDIPDATPVTCDLTVTAKSHPFYGRGYKFVETIEIGHSSSVEVSLEPVDSSLSVGTSLESLLRINVSEVVAFVEVEVLCGDDEDFILTEVELVRSLESVIVVEGKREVASSCAKISLSFSPSVPTDQLQYQIVTLKSSLILTKMNNNLAVMNYKIIVGSEASEASENLLTQKISTCSPSVTIDSSLISSGSPYIKSEEEISYKILISNTASCSFFIKTLEYLIKPTDASYIDERNVKIQSGEELEFQFDIKTFPEKLTMLEPVLTVIVGTSLLSEFSLDISREMVLPRAYLISPVVILTPPQFSLLPHEVLEVTLDLSIPYLVGGTGQIDVTSSTVGCVLLFSSILSTGSDLSVSQLSPRSSQIQSFSVSKNNQNSDLLSSTSLLSLVYTLEVAEQRDQYQITFTTSLGEAEVVISGTVEVRTPHLVVKMESGDRGVGYIPGDIVLLSLTVFHSEDSRSDAEHPVLLVNTPHICEDSTVLTGLVQVKTINSTTQSVSLPDIPLEEEIRISIQCEIPDTTDTEGKSYTYNVLLNYMSPSFDSSEEGWNYSKAFQTNLQLGEPEISFNITTVPTPETLQSIRCKVLLRKGSSDLTVYLTLSEDLSIEKLSLIEVGAFLSFEDDVYDLSLDDETFIEATEDGLTLSLGEVICSNETKDRRANSFVLELSVFINTSLNTDQHVTGSVRFGRGEDTATLPVKVQIPELDVNIQCEVDGADCGDVIEVNSKSFVTYIVTVYHTVNSTGPAYNVMLQLYVSLFDLEVISTDAPTGTVEKSGLGVKLSKRELLTTQTIVWQTVLSVKNYKSFSDCSTAIVSLYDNSETDNNGPKMLPIIINNFTPKHEETFPSPEMYGRGILGSRDHDTLYICNTSCSAVLNGGELVKLNSAIHSLIGLTVTRTQYMLYGISQSGAYVMSTSLDNWISIPPQIWTEAGDTAGGKVTPRTGLWPQTVDTSTGIRYTATEEGVSVGDALIFVW